MEKVRRTLRVTGKVQGVWYRKSAVDKGRELGLDGTAQNQDDGSVALAVEGGRTEVEAFIAWCRKGPPLARVKAVEVSEGGTIPRPGFHVVE